MTMERAVEALRMALRTKKMFTYKEYVKAHPSSTSTAWRDFCKLRDEGIIKQNGLLNDDMRVPTYNVRTGIGTSAICPSALRLRPKEKYLKPE